MDTPVIRPLYRAVNKPLTILGVERRLFFVAMVAGAGVFAALSSLLGAIAMFAGLFLFGRWATQADPQILTIYFNSSSFRLRYDAAKYTPIRVRVIR